MLNQGFTEAAMWRRVGAVSKLPGQTTKLIRSFGRGTPGAEAPSLFEQGERRPEGLLHPTRAVSASRKVGYTKAKARFDGEEQVTKDEIQLMYYLVPPCSLELKLSVVVSSQHQL